ncbi:hypothetical protein Goshw_001834 [Gossypium schwendimanii]|uniref:Uncharacterized protein n=2 Tax=Gossypium schwendimanii TaxID=34291 RepID=A0A7J9MZJ0_GOSSC|nr:hypothetical protein [Gossypium schwendimanii]
MRQSLICLISPTGGYTSPSDFGRNIQVANACRRAGEGRFIGCAQLVLA